MGQRIIRVTGKPKEQIDVDLLVQAILLITEQQLQRPLATPTESQPEAS